MIKQKRRDFIVTEKIKTRKILKNMKQRDPKISNYSVKDIKEEYY